MNPQPTSATTPTPCRWPHRQADPFNSSTWSARQGPSRFLLGIADSWTWILNPNPTRHCVALRIAGSWGRWCFRCPRRHRGGTYSCVRSERQGLREPDWGRLSCVGWNFSEVFESITFDCHRKDDKRFGKWRMGRSSPVWRRSPLLEIAAETF